MKFRRAAIAITLISLTMVWGTSSAAPMLWRPNPLWKNQPLSSQALVQQEDTPSSKDKEMAATYCKLLVNMFKNYFNLIEGSVDDYCSDIELGLEPRPEEKADILAKSYKLILDTLKKMNLNELLNG